MRERNVTIVQVQSVLKNGSVIEGLAPSTVHGGWECAFHGMADGGLKVVVGFGKTDDGMDVVVVTVVVQAASRSKIMDLDNYYHYTECGLEYVYLENGFEFIETPWGKGVHVDSAEALHAELGRMVACLERPLSGTELRFLRERLEMTQEQFAELIGYKDGQQVGAWERGKSKVPRPVEAVLRELYLEAYPPDQPAGLRQLLAQLIRTVDVKPVPVTLREQDDQWSSEEAVLA